MFGLSRKEKAEAALKQRQAELAARQAEMLQRMEDQRREAAERAEQTRRLLELEAEQRRQRLEQEQLIKEQERQRKEQERLLREQEKQEREQRRQAEQLAKHERRIADLEFRMTQAETDILHWSETVNSLYALLDVELSTQAGAMPGSKTDVRCQKRIITLNNQIHAAEARVNRARHIKQMASMELAQ